MINTLIAGPESAPMQEIAASMSSLSAARSMLRNLGSEHLALEGQQESTWHATGIVATGPRALYDVGVAFFEMDLLDKAIAFLRAAADGNGPEAAGASELLSVCLFRKGERAEAFRRYLSGLLQGLVGDPLSTLPSYDSACRCRGSSRAALGLHESFGTTHPAAESGLRRLNIFDGLGAEQLRCLASSFVELAVPADSIVLQEQDAGALYLVESGLVELREEVPGTGARILTCIEPGEFFYEFGVYDDHLGTQSARTRVASRLHIISRNNLRRFLWHHLGAARRLLEATRGLMRRHERTPVGKFVDLMDRHGESCVAEIVDLSTGGMRIRPVPPGWARAGQAVNFHLVVDGAMLEFHGEAVSFVGDSVGIDLGGDEYAPKIEWIIRKLMD